MTRLSLAFLLAVASASAWTDPVEVTMGPEKCVAYDAKWEGGYLTVRATHFGEWHTYAMDNEARAEEKLAGKMSLGIDGPTQIAVSGGAKAVGAWYETEPKDLSKPDIRWYTFGYDEPAMFVTKIEGGGPATIDIRAQACTATQCKNVEVSLTVPAGQGSAPDLGALVPVRTADSTR